MFIRWIVPLEIKAIIDESIYKNNIMGIDKKWFKYSLYLILMLFGIAYVRSIWMHKANLNFMEQIHSNIGRNSLFLIKGIDKEKRIWMDSITFENRYYQQIEAVVISFQQQLDELYQQIEDAKDINSLKRIWIEIVDRLDDQFQELHQNNPRFSRIDEKQMKRFFPFLANEKALFPLQNITNLDNCKIQFLTKQALLSIRIKKYIIEELSPKCSPWSLPFKAYLLGNRLALKEGEKSILQFAVAKTNQTTFSCAINGLVSKVENATVRQKINALFERQDSIVLVGTYFENSRLNGAFRNIEKKITKVYYLK